MCPENYVGYMTAFDGLPLSFTLLLFILKGHSEVIFFMNFLLDVTPWIDASCR